MREKQQTEGHRDNIINAQKLSAIRPNIVNILILITALSKTILEFRHGVSYEKLRIMTPLGCHLG